MNSINLAQVSALVVGVSMASFFVSAEDALANNVEAGSVLQIESSITTASEKVETMAESNDKFSFTSLDTDKNGKLSLQEVGAGKNEWLVKSFKQIDNNADESITEQELVDFIAEQTAATK